MLGQHAVSVLHDAVSKNHREIVTVLLEQKADVNAADNVRFSVFFPFCDSLVKSMKFQDGASAVHDAAYNGRVEMIELLVNCFVLLPYIF